MTTLLVLAGMFAGVVLVLLLVACIGSVLFDAYGMDHWAPRGPRRGRRVPSTRYRRRR